MLSVVVCPSVCLSVTFVCCIQTAKDIVKLFLGLIAHHYSSLRPLPNSNENPLSKGVKYTGWVRKNLRLSTEIAVYLGNDTI